MVKEILLTSFYYTLTFLLHVHMSKMWQSERTTSISKPASFLDVFSYELVFTLDFLVLTNNVLAV